jgi:hypothetical protein
MCEKSLLLETTLPSDKRIDQVDEFWDSDANEDS